MIIIDKPNDTPIDGQIFYDIESGSWYEFKDGKWVKTWDINFIQTELHRKMDK